MLGLITRRETRQVAVRVELVKLKLSLEKEAESTRKRGKSGSKFKQCDINQSEI